MSKVEPCTVKLIKQKNFRNTSLAFINSETWKTIKEKKKRLQMLLV